MGNVLNELQLDKAAFDLWISAEGTDNIAELERVKRILPMILEECCTENQLKYIVHYFVDQMTIAEIAERYCVNKATVSRAIHAGLDKAYPYLKFCSPLFINAPKKRGYLRRSVKKVKWGG